ncbi:hypothetical protein [Nitrospira sp. Kam-Ns4a]
MEGKPAKSPTVAGILSGVLPGLGQFYCRQWKKGVGFLIGALVADGAFGASAGFVQLLHHLLAGSPPPEAGSIVLRSLPLFAVAIWSIVDAVRTAKASMAAT